jgi:hypothetical protein
MTQFWGPSQNQWRRDWRSCRESPASRRMQHWNACWSGLAHQVCWCQTTWTGQNCVRPSMAASLGRRPSDMTDAQTLLSAMATGHCVHVQSPGPVARVILTWAKARDLAGGFSLPRASRRGRTGSAAATCSRTTRAGRVQIAVVVGPVCRLRRRRWASSSPAAVAPAAERRWHGRTAASWTWPRPHPPALSCGCLTAVLWALMQAEGHWVRACCVDGRPYCWPC